MLFFSLPWNTSALVIIQMKSTEFWQFKPERRMGLPIFSSHIAIHLGSSYTLFANALCLQNRKSESWKWVEHWSQINSFFQSILRKLQTPHGGIIQPQLCSLGNCNLDWEKLCSEFSKHIFTHQEKPSALWNDQKTVALKNITVVENGCSLSFSDI